MGKIFGILFIVVGIWVGLEIYTEGTHNAFGGLFARWSGERPTAGEAVDSAARRVGRGVQSAHDEHGERFQRALGE